MPGFKQQQPSFTSNPFQPLANTAQSPGPKAERPPLPGASASAAPVPGQETAKPVSISSSKSKKKRGSHKKKRGRRKSFAVLPEESHDEAPLEPARPDLYLQTGRNLSNTSIESQALLDHR